MANDYFDSGDYTAIQADSFQRSSAINAIAQAIEAGFDKLPAETALKENRVTHGTFHVSSTANVHVVNLPHAPASYSAGLHISYVPTVANTGAVTVNVDGNGAVAIKRPDGSTLQASDIVPNVTLELRHNGTNFNVIGAPPGMVSSAAGSATAAAASASAAATSAASAASEASNAATSATAAAASASTASTQATNAANSATTASTQATNAATSASTATTQATNAATSATNAATSEANALTYANAAEAAAAAIFWNFDTSTTMADPGTGDIRLNHATLASVTAIAVSALSNSSGNPDVSDYIATWDDSTSSVKGNIVIRESGQPATMLVFAISGAITDNGTWLQIPVTHVASNGTLSAGDDLYLSFSRAGDAGAVSSVTAADSSIVVSGSASAPTIQRGELTGDVTASAGSNATTISTTLVNSQTTATAASGDYVLIADVSASNVNKKVPVSDLLAEALIIAASDETTALTTGTAKITIPAPYAMTLTGIKGFLSTAQTSGSALTADVNLNGTSIMTTNKLVFDNGEQSTLTAATAPALTTTAIAADDKISVDIDTVGDGTAKGLKVTLLGYKT